MGYSPSVTQGHEWPPTRTSTFCLTPHVPSTEARPPHRSRGPGLNPGSIPPSVCPPPHSESHSPLRKGEGTATSQDTMQLEWNNAGGAWRTAGILQVLNKGCCLQRGSGCGRPSLRPDRQASGSSLQALGTVPAASPGVDAPRRNFGAGSRRGAVRRGEAQATHSPPLPPPCEQVWLGGCTTLDGRHLCLTGLTTPLPTG